ARRLQRGTPAFIAKLPHAQGVRRDPKTTHPTIAGGLRNGLNPVQLADGSISAKLGSQAHMLDQMTPMKGAMKPWTVALFERAISTGVDQNGEQLSPVMPRWSMSARDLHDIAVYISTQIR
ncbi:MAG: hypothetical protein ACYDCA_03525, partial [Candidatus Tyrphobacter sp.]